MSDLMTIACRACGEDRPLDEYRLFATQPEKSYMDFCVHCEKRESTITLYRRFHAYGTVGIVNAVYAAERIPAGKRTEAQTRLLVAAKDVQEPTSNEDIIRRELARRELASRRLIFFTTAFLPEYKPGWVHQDICRRLERFVQRVERGESPRLMIAMPPRAGKSQLASDILPSWILGKHPEWSIIGASYAQSLPVEFSRNIRDRLKDPEYAAIFPNTKLRADSQGVEAWKTTKGGGYIAAGVGVGINGKGMHIGIADDLIKDAEAAQSDTIRSNSYSWYQSVFRTRLAPGGGILLIGCLTGDTQITMGDGTRKRIDAVRAGDEVKSWKDGELVVRPVVNWAPQAVDDVFEVRTGNSAVRANARHPFLVRSAKGHHKWVRVRDMAALGVNNCLVHTGVEPTDGAVDQITMHQAKLLGFMFGDGWLTRRDGKNYDKQHGVYYPRRGIVTCVAKGVHAATNDWVVAAFKTEFDVDLAETKCGYYRTETQRAGQWFAEHGLNGTAHTKRLPMWLFTQSLDVRRAFLNGFIDADGYVTAERQRVTITLCSEDLIMDVRSLARSVGLKPSNVHVATRMAQAPNSPMPIEVRSANVQWQHEAYDEAPFFYRRIRSVKPAGREMVYDMEVEDTHNYIADGIVSHNTRWHDADVQGQELAKEDLLRKQGVPEHELESWEVVSYPAIADNDEYLLSDGSIWTDKSEPPEEAPRLLRHKGEALHPERYSLGELMKLKHFFPPAIWSALYQQNPTPDDGEFFKRSDFRYQYLAPGYWPAARVFITFDLAISTKKKNDYTVGAVFALTAQNELYVLDIVRGRWGTKALVEVIVNLIEKYKPEVFAGERGQIHEAIWPLVKESLLKKNLYISNDDSLVPLTDKEVRARPLQGRMQMHQLFFSFQAISRPEIYDEVEKELLRFPNGTHDDIVDALAWGARLAMNLSLPTERQPKQLRSWRDDLRPDTGGASHMAS